jgi:hypothetical protein
MEKAFFLLAVILACCAGCAPARIIASGSDRDIHGCISSAGYTWCENRRTCVRMWE